MPNTFGWGTSNNDDGTKQNDDVVHNFDDEMTYGANRDIWEPDPLPRRPRRSNRIKKRS